MNSVRRVAPLLIIVLAVAASVTAADLTSQGPSSADLALDEPPSNVKPPPLDPNVFLQGGDTCAAAAVIGALPFTADGTTVGYTNDYDEACPFTSTSPDVVYSYTPATDTVIDVALCTGTTNYDTKLFIYEGTCASPRVACNEDRCDAPLYPNAYISALTRIPLTGGQTYYIVVDGYGGESGNYTIDVSEWQQPPPPPECDGPDLLYYQTARGPDDPEWASWSSGETTSFDRTVYDNFTSSMYSITDFHWWGFSLFWTGAGWIECDPTGMTFDVSFHADSAGLPGAALCTYAGLTPTPVAGASYNDWTLYYWEVTGLSPACAQTGATWVGVHSYPNTSDCVLSWIVANGGDRVALRDNGGVWESIANDFSLCITGQGPLFFDGFESGDTSAWSATLP